MVEKARIELMDHDCDRELAEALIKVANTDLSRSATDAVARMVGLSDAPFPIKLSIPKRHAFEIKIEGPAGVGTITIDRDGCMETVRHLCGQNGKPN